MNGGVTLQLALDALATAGIYAIVGMAVLVAHSGTRVLHLAIGHVAMAGALVAAGLAASVPVWLAAIAGVAVAGALSAVGERALVAPVVRSVELAALLLLAAGVVVGELLRGLYGRSGYAFPSVGGTVHAGGGTLRIADIVTVAAAVVVAGTTRWVIHSTLAGAALRVTAALDDSWH